MLLSFIAEEALVQGEPVTISTTVSGQIISLNSTAPRGATAIGVSLDTLSSGALCRVAPDGTAPIYSSLVPGTTYFASTSGNYLVDYPQFVTEFNQLGFSNIYLTQIGISLTPSILKISTAEPKLVVSGFL